MPLKSRARSEIVLLESYLGDETSEDKERQRGDKNTRTYVEGTKIQIFVGQFRYLCAVFSLNFNDKN